MIHSDYEFEKLNKYREKAVKATIYNSYNITRYKSCPYCGSKEFILFGKYQGIQRYRCKNKKCKRTFSNTTNSVWKYLKCTPEKWIKFIELMSENKTLEQCAYILKISVVTAFNWRHKILHAIENECKPEKFRELLKIKTHLTVRCYKGSRNKNYTYKEKINNKINKMYGITPRDVSVLFANEGENMPLIRSSIAFEENLQENFKDNVLSITDKCCYIHPERLFDRKLIQEIVDHNKKLPIKIRKKYGVKIKAKANIINDNIKDDRRAKNFIAYLAGWLYGFKGIATKYINHYYNFYSLIYSEKNFDYMYIFFKLLKNGIYTSVHEMQRTHLENY